MTTELQLNQINISGDTQQRDINDDTVEEYMDLMRDRCEFPPVQIIFDGKDYWLWDGFHRYHAAKKLKRKTIKADVVEGTKRDAVLASFSANRDHGFQRQKGDTRKIIEKILADEEWSKMPLTKIAKIVGGSRQYVSKIAKKMDYEKSHPATGCEIETGETESKREIKRAEKIDVNRGGQSYSMKNPAMKKLTTAAGQDVPEHLVPIFERVNELKSYVQQCTNIMKPIKKAVAEGDPLMNYLNLNSLEVAMGNVKRVFKFAIPFAVCAYCQADDSQDCKCCKGIGFINQTAWTATPEEMRS